MQEESEILVITENDKGLRLDKILALRLKEAGSRTYFQSLIDEGKVLLNGFPTKKRLKVNVGDEVEIEYVLTPELSLKPENIPLNIIYEDDALIVVNKLPGMVVHPGIGNWGGTFVNALLFHCKDLINETKESLRPGIVHRIDKDTSGLLIAAKTSFAHQQLVRMFAEREVFKEYLAICIGAVGEGRIEASIARHPVNRKMMSVVQEGGKLAITHYRRLHFDQKLSVVSIVIETGRTHQIRVHMKHLGTPILGDATYGIPSYNAKYGLSRQMLHAHQLILNHPLSGKKMEFIAEIPHDMQNVISKIKMRD